MRRCSAARSSRLARGGPAGGPGRRSPRRRRRWRSGRTTGRLAADRLAVPARRLAGRPGLAPRRRLEVYVRPKLGFCGNCETGVVTDEEVDRVTDIDLLDERFAPVQEGSRIRIADLSGRARLYATS